MASNKVSQKQKPLPSIFPLLLRNAWRTSNVIINRYLGLPPRYCPVLLLFLTGRCNLRCRICGVCDLEHGYNDEEELSTEQWKEVISAAAEKLGTTLAVVSGGEALLREDVFEIIHYAENKGISVHLCTNALLLNEDKMERLRDSGVSTVSFSLDGPEAFIHDDIRGEGNFDKTVSAIRKFHTIAPEIHMGINFVITKQNYRRMIEMLHFAESLGAGQIKFAPLHTNLLHRNKDFSGCDNLVFHSEDLPDLEREVRRTVRECHKSRLITTSAAFFDGIVDLYKQPRRIRCYAGYAVCAVNPAGYVAPCNDIDSPFSVKDYSIDAIWHDPGFHKIRKQVHACQSPCWDTAYTELSLWLRPTRLLVSVVRNVRDIKFYFGRRKE
ncbi:MAG TPA: radical SAM protein [Candidatus Hydrogenedentes bacterium]|nr:radical SAM protein [Candidatus Hydrogenedentota bacterium]